MPENTLRLMDILDIRDGGGEVDFWLTLVIVGVLVLAFSLGATAGPYQDEDEWP